MNVSFHWIPYYADDLTGRASEALEKIAEWKISPGFYAIPIYRLPDNCPYTYITQGGSSTRYMSNRIISFVNGNLTCEKNCASPRSLVTEFLETHEIEEIRDHSSYKCMIEYLIEEHYRFMEIGSLLTSPKPLDRKFGKYLSDL